MYNSTISYDFNVRSDIKTVTNYTRSHLRISGVMTRAATPINGSNAIVLYSDILLTQAAEPTIATDYNTEVLYVFSTVHIRKSSPDYYKF